MNNGVLDFLEAYKKLDELCKQFLSNNRGISEYIDEMNKESQGRLLVWGWEKDYKQLKRMRWIRNKLVHETTSFQEGLFDKKDIEWLQNFSLRMKECTDPFSLLYQSQKRKRTTSVQKNCSNQAERFWVLIGILILIIMVAVGTAYIF